MTTAPSPSCAVLAVAPTIGGNPGKSLPALADTCAAERAGIEVPVNEAVSGRPKAPVQGASITRSTIWNFAGIAAPVPVALIAIPLLIAGMGQERFGVLTIAWALMGYFSVFDLGLSRATTSVLAKAYHSRDDERARVLFWSSAAAHLALGLLGGLILLVAAPFIESSLTIDPALRAETRTALYLLALSVPVVVLTAVARGLLEALHRFDLVNLVKVPASVVTYLGPVLALTFTNRLPPIIAVILLARAAVLLSYVVLCARALPTVRTLEVPRLAVIVPLAAAGGWMTVGTILSPVLVSIDRFVIGSAVSVAAVAAYAAPYEVVTKLWMFSGSLMGVLFPRLSILESEHESLGLMYRRAVAALALATTPVAAAIVAFAPEFFTLWLGPGIAQSGVGVARWLTLGVLVNVLAQVPYTTLQATGHADAAGKLQLLEMPLYAVVAWLAAGEWGVVGVAMAWSGRAAIDAVLLFLLARRRLGALHGPNASSATVIVAGTSALLMLWCWQLVPLLVDGFISKALLTGVGITIFIVSGSRALQVDLKHIRALLRS